MATIALPSGKVVDLLDPIIPGSNFFWYEATNGGDRERVITTQAEVDGIVEMARAAQRVRSLLAEPMIVTSWFRPESLNTQVGGAPNSLHILGRGMDFYCNSKTPLTIYRLLDPTWTGGMGLYSGHIHIDVGLYGRF